jgi:hypothetical protein
MPCVDEILSRLHLRHPRFADLYVRRDRADRIMGRTAP